MKPTRSIAAQIATHVRDAGLEPGTHLPAQMLADRLRVSRSPVNEALAGLEATGLVQRQPNRGFFLARLPTPHELGEQTPDGQGAPADPLTATYFRIAEDRLAGTLPDDVTESALRQRYSHLTATQLAEVLARIRNEGWIEKKQGGYGWSFSTMMMTADSLLQSYRLRLALEPAALLEPGYRLDPAVLQRCRAAELHLLEEGGIETDTPDQLHDRGVRFHESLVEASGNPFFIDAIRRVNRVRRLLSYRSMRDRRRYEEHCRQHLYILDLLAEGRNGDAAEALRRHLDSTLRNLGSITQVLG